jgi:hypothetical protein
MRRPTSAALPIAFMFLGGHGKISASRDSAPIRAGVSEQIPFRDHHGRAEDRRQSVTDAIARDLKQVFESAGLHDRRARAEFPTGSLEHLEDVDCGHSVSVEVGISVTLQKMNPGNAMRSRTTFKTSEVEQRLLPGVVAEMSRGRSEAATQLVSWMQSRVPQSSFRANDDSVEEAQNG